MTIARVLTILALLLLATPASGQIDADFACDVTSGSNPLGVSFSDTSTGGTPFAWMWSFGDGATSMLPAPLHTYTSPGTYTVSLTVLFAGLGSDSETKVDHITVTPAEVVASFTASNTAGTALLQTSFTDTSSGPVDAWHWDFGDGGQSTQQHPVHAYTTPGSYTVSLTPSVGGQVAAPAVQVDLVTVAPVPLAPSFTASATQIADAWTVTFTGTSASPPTNWWWDFGDGSSANGNPAWHTYFAQDPASLDVSLSVSYYGQLETVAAAGLIAVAGGPFGAVRTVPTESVIPGVGINDVTAGDLDGDGDRDLVTAGAGVAWYPNLDGHGNFGPAQYVAPSGSQYDAVDLADLDGDGGLDVLTASVSSTLRVYLSVDGAGAFESPQSTAGTEGTVEIELGDLDLDGDLDVVLGRGFASVWAYGNDGTGQLELLANVVPFATGIERDTLCVDLDADGDADVLAAGTGTAPTLHRNADGLGTTWTATAVAVAQSAAVGVADVDGDGDPDVVGSGLITSQPVWYANDGAGLFGPPQPLGSPSAGGTPLAAGDVDGDGDGDVVTGSKVSLPGTVLWSERTAGGWSSPVPISAKVSTLARVLLADLDGDERLDAVYALGNSLFWQPFREAPRWTDAGPGLAGASGVPALAASGALEPGATVSLALSDAAPGGVSTLVLGLSALHLPFKGGVFVPNPDVLLPLPVDSNGQLVVNAMWPLAVPAGTTVWAQHWIPDGGALHGLASSNGLASVPAD